MPVKTGKWESEVSNEKREAGQVEFKIFLNSSFLDIHMDILVVVVQKSPYGQAHQNVK